jgi:ferrous iron transport protein A
VSLKIVMTSLVEHLIDIPRVIASLDASAEDAAMLDGVGLSPGRTVTVLRRAPFGGPLHVRVDTGVEVAIDRALAAHVTLAPEAP